MSSDRMDAILKLEVAKAVAAAMEHILNHQGKQFEEMKNAGKPKKIGQRKFSTAFMMP